MLKKLVRIVSFKILKHFILPVESSFNIFFVKLLPGISKIPGFSSSLVRKPLLHVNSVSDILTLYGQDKCPATRNSTVLCCCLYWLHVDNCMKRSDGVSVKLSLPSITSYAVANVPLKADGNAFYLFHRWHPIHFHKSLIQGPGCDVN